MSDDSSAQPSSGGDDGIGQMVPGENRLLAVDNDGYAGVLELRSKLITLLTAIVGTMTANQWDAVAIKQALEAMYRCLTLYDNDYEGKLLLGVIQMEWNTQRELLINATAHHVSY
jgi:hypothetical protein